MTKSNQRLCVLMSGVVLNFLSLVFVWRHALPSDLFFAMFCIMYGELTIFHATKNEFVDRGFTQGYREALKDLEDHRSWLIAYESGLRQGLGINKEKESEKHV